MDGPKNRNRQSPSARVGIGDVIQMERPLTLEGRDDQDGGAVLPVDVTRKTGKRKCGLEFGLGKNWFFFADPEEGCEFLWRQ